MTLSGICLPTPAQAEPFLRTGSFRSNKYFYSFVPPASCSLGNKPVQTHLDEINFNSKTIQGYTYGITIDPVRINSLEEFGSPDEVGQKVIDAEAARDGVTEVKLLSAKRMEKSLGSLSCYAIDYRSEGKRGVKIFNTRIYVKDGLLYVLTGQVKESAIEDSDGTLRAEFEKALDSFTVGQSDDHDQKSHLK
eukprot:CAMPEP_0113316038 /NCGR_PEP_ID=MMETSP0010_2-20120614/11459_1 /TAXON_ID=216773 ORGANISM="Corethron hystrix, Strain 308" /NCGR_SAMPLE_ID=MMETSP0010_2 /ASSEMBLY_ACC=CAM_ASM_000155 /LENGTH=191 /DNA_ID=CAMNT_0000172645 /DNA_START=173 /DNA_END=748 /DNA_ORIENTATION=+ /assembly_acc=CAM_ASM_000155